MLGRLSLALLVAASPALAGGPAATDAPPAEAPAQDYVIKKVCQTYEVAGSMIPRRSCINKKVPVKKPAGQAQEAAAGKSGEARDETKAPQNR